MEAGGEGTDDVLQSLYICIRCVIVIYDYDIPCQHMHGDAID